MVRGFEQVEDKFIKNFDIFTDEKKKVHHFPRSPQLPVRSDKGSAGYDFHASKETKILPGEEKLMWTDVKAYMKEDEVLMIYIRSSLAIKVGLTLTNSTGIIDASYYGNESNDGNIGISIKNTSGRAYIIKEGERIAQGIFLNYLVADEDKAEGKREGGIGSTGK